jgi:cation transport regulator
MPYRTNADLPASVRENLPDHAQTIFRNTFDAAIHQPGITEQIAFKIAWAAMEKVYEKRDGRWIQEELHSDFGPDHVGNIDHESGFEAQVSELGMVVEGGVEDSEDDAPAKKKSPRFEKYEEDQAHNERQPQQGKEESQQ